jgi:hypothetical protein
LVKGLCFEGLGEALGAGEQLAFGERVSGFGGGALGLLSWGGEVETSVLFGWGGGGSLFLHFYW